MRRPSMWVDDAGVMHIDAAAMCLENGYEPTDANQEMIVAAAREMFADPVVVDDSAG